MITRRSTSNIPFARRDDIVEDYHGIKVADPYRWLENPSSEDTLAWVEAQNALMSHYIEAIPARKKIQARMTALWDYAKYSVPLKKGGFGKPTAKLIEERSDVLAFLFERFGM